MSVLTRELVLKRLEQRINHVIPVKIQGILLALISTGLFVLVGVLVRILSERIDLFQILLFRQLVFIVLLLPSVKASIDILLKPRQVKLHFLRIFGAFLALYLGFVTVSHIPLADATALGFTQVLFVAVISRLFLSEAVGLSRLLTILIGFAGVILVVQPEFNQSAVYTLTGLIAASGAAVAVVCVRKMAQTEPRVVLLSYQAVFVGLIALLPSLMSWQWPTLYELMLLILVGVISSVAQWIGITAYKLAEANVIANVEYAKIVYSLALGYWLFAETPDTLAVLGVLIIFTSAILPLLMTFLSVRRFSSNQPPV
ncbi:DMT family transporter [Oceanospirillum sediminis]|uniref:DMT family transporter n=1 Tax=Oceanospirillum sediminis TaxID=2760088 RepID=A0A839ISQ6_9GAMM|nr:DMT family transporter [Oceanospirillum sediminis]MBB1487612.1 DMT family transporter [Oceanospirillum sediminis]